MTDYALPARYHTRWRQPYEDQIAARLREGMTILDIGAGRHPTLLPQHRPPRTTYVGLDISADEMRAAGPDAYDDMQAADVTSLVPALIDRVDLAVSWQVFEHVKPLDGALDNVYEYLHPGGALVSQFSGRWSVFGILNQLIPDALGHRIVERVMNRRAQNVPIFPAHYHRCSARQLRKMTVSWHSVEILPLFRGATYFNFSGSLTHLYLWYEEQARRRGAANLASHYLLIARGTGASHRPAWPRLTGAMCLLARGPRTAAVWDAPGYQHTPCTPAVGCNDRACSHDASAADADGAHDRRAEPDQVVATEYYMLRCASSLGKHRGARVVKAVIIPDDRHPARNEDVIAYGEVGLQVEIAADSDVVAEPDEVRRIQNRVRSEAHVVTHPRGKRVSSPAAPSGACDVRRPPGQVRRIPGSGRSPPRAVLGPRHLRRRLEYPISHQLGRVLAAGSCQRSPNAARAPSSTVARELDESVKRTLGWSVGCQPTAS